MKILSLAGLAAMVAALLGLWEMGALFSPSPLIIAVQVAAGGLMLWARFAFGRRSFHAAANPTSGGLVTSGPYRFVRHPIYAAIILFLAASVCSHPSPLTISLGLLAFAGALIRLFCEESLLVERYPEYREYARHTRRLLPGVW